MDWVAGPNIGRPRKTNHQTMLPSRPILAGTHGVRKQSDRPAIPSHPDLEATASSDTVPLETIAHQYESLLMTSAPATVPSALHTVPLIVVLANRTLPSANRVFTPPGW
jgi:hypothetical protein